MKSNFKVLSVVISALVVGSMSILSGCTDTTMATYEAYGKPHDISVYQYDKEIYHAVSTGKVAQDAHSIQFMDKDTGELVDISLGQSSTVITKVLP